MKYWLSSTAKYFGLMIVAFVFVGATHAHTYTTVNLTSNNPNNDGYIGLNNAGDIAWSGWVGDSATGNWELFIYKAATALTTQITNTPSTNESLYDWNAKGDLLWAEFDRVTGATTALWLLNGTNNQRTKLNVAPTAAYTMSLNINESGDVIWMQSDAIPDNGNSADIFFYNSVSRTTINISNSNFRDEAPQFFNGRDVVWTHTTAPVASTFPLPTYEAKVYSATSLTTRTLPINLVFNQDNLIDTFNARGDAVWVTSSGTRLDRYDAVSNSVATLATVAAGISYPRIDPSGNVSYFAYNTGTTAFELYYYKASTGVSSTIAQGAASGPTGFMSNGDVIYSTGNSLYVYNLASQQTRNISHDAGGTARLSNFRSNGDTIWTNARGDVLWTNGVVGNLADFSVYHAATGTIDHITDDTVEDFNPSLNDAGVVAWVKYDSVGLDYDVYYAKPTPLTTTGPVPTITIAANPTIVTSGGSSTLTWSSTNATSCTASGANPGGQWTGAKPTSGSQVLSNLTSNDPLARTYQLICTGTGGLSIQNTVIFVQGDTLPPSTPTLNPPTDVYNQQLNLSWSTSIDNVGGSGLNTNFVERCQGAGCTTWTQITSIRSYTAYRDDTLTLCTSYSYRVRVSDQAGNYSGYSNTASATSACALDTARPSVPTLNAPSSVTNNSMLLSWSSSTDTGGSGLDFYLLESCMGSGCTNFLPLPAEPYTKALVFAQVAPSTTYRFRIRARDKANNFSNYSNVVSATTLAAGGVPSVTLIASLTSVAFGGATTVSWASANTTTCTASGAWSFVTAGSGGGGFFLANLATTGTYVMTCAGPGGSASASTTVTVTAPPSSSLPGVTLSASPTSIAPAGFSVLTWSTTNATTCTASGANPAGQWTGAKTLSGSQALINLTTTGTYTLTCAGPGGNSSPKSVTVSVGTSGNTGLRNPAANSSNSGGDGNGFQTNATQGYLDDGVFAVDTDSGNGTSTSCTSGNKDKHRFYNYGFVIPSGVTIKGIEIRLDAKVDSPNGAPKMCVELSWDGGSTWTTAQSTAALTSAEATYTLGSATDTWGRTWSTTNLSNANFRMRIVNVASDISRDFSLDWAAVRVHY